MNEEIILEKFAARFSELIKSSSIDVIKLAEMLGLKSKSTIYRYMNGIMTPKLTTIKYASEIFNVNPLWLMGYDVPKERNKMQKSNSTVVFVYGTIPAGIPMEMIEDILDTEEISADMLKGGKEYFGLKVKGDSMYPEYKENDVVICEKVDDCENGDECIIMINGNDATFKKVIKNENGIILQPLNPQYQPMVYSNEDIKKLPIRIIGKVVEMRRKK